MNEYKQHRRHNNMMKKSIVAVVLTAVMCFATSTSAFAANGLSSAEQSILNKLQAGVEVDGHVVQVPAAYINQAENELMKNKTDLTAAQAKEINSIIDQVVALAKEENIKSAADLKASASKDKIVSLVKNAASVAGYKVALDAATGTVTVADPDSNVAFTSKNVINQTGFDMQATVAVAIALVSLLAASVVVADKKKLFAKPVKA
jgi:hypothetical protein